MLLRLLGELAKQPTEGLFTYSVVIVDNDEAASSREAVEEFRADSKLVVKYLVESKRGINAARNTSFANAEGQYIAIIDDDELPAADWLVTLYKELLQYSQASGILGPVLRHFDQTPPKWLEQSGFYVRRVNLTGMPVDWREARTGNVLIRRQIVQEESGVFKEDVAYGGDQEFFRRKMVAGHSFIWSSGGAVYEVIPPARWKVSYLVKKALLRGDSTTRRGGFGPASLLKSIVALPIYLLAIPFARLMGKHHAVTLLVKLCDHAGKVFASFGMHFVRGLYISEPSES